MSRPCSRDAASAASDCRLGPGVKVALLMEGCLDDDMGKLGLGMLRYGRATNVAIIDETEAGKKSGDIFGQVLPEGERREVPIVASVDEAAAMGAEVLVLAITPLGGRLPPSWRVAIGVALDLGLSLVNPLHQRLAADQELSSRLGPGRWIWDLRAEPENPSTASGLARNLPAPRILVVGTDMAVGKMTAGLELARSLTKRGLRTAFVATGQTGICLTGDGIALDAIRVDYAAGAVEQAVLRIGAGADVVIVEGQGALTHPSAGANLALLRGSMPTHLLLVHRAGQRHPLENDWVEIPRRSRLIRLYEDLAHCEGAFIRPHTFGVALNTARLRETEAKAAIEEEIAETGLAVTDPVRFDPAPLSDAFFELFEASSD